MFKKHLSTGPNVAKNTYIGSIEGIFTESVFRQNLAFLLIGFLFPKKKYFPTKMKHRSLDSFQKTWKKFDFPERPRKKNILILL